MPEQIKTISSGSAEAFDKMVNEALNNGWRIKRRGIANFAYYAELVKAERTCDNCRHQNTETFDPCLTCNADYDKWSPIQEEPPCETN